MSVKLAKPELESLGELLASLGGISPDRVRLTPAPGTATVRDLVRLSDKTGRLYELINGTLVEKVMGAKASFVANILSFFMNSWNVANGNLGMILGPDGMMKLMRKLVRIPDVSFTNWDRLPNRQVPDEAVPDLAPDLAVEVLSEGNTRQEMAQKLTDYFRSDVRLVWYIDPRRRTVRVYTSPDEMTELDEADTLTGDAVLPGFAIEVARLFDQLAPAVKPAKPKANGKPPKKRK